MQRDTCPSAHDGPFPAHDPETSVPVSLYPAGKVFYSVLHVRDILALIAIGFVKWGGLPVPFCSALTVMPVHKQEILISHLTSSGPLTAIFIQNYSSGKPY